MYRFHLRLHQSLRNLGFVVAVLWPLMPALQAAALPTMGLMGSVKSSDGKPLEGVAVSALGQGKTYTTSVYSNRRGEYYFPALDSGQYRIWAQAVGFEMARSEQTITPNKKVVQNFSMKPMADFHKQLSGTEWLDSLPSETAEDRRMRDVLHNMCTNCHLTGALLIKRFDAAGWGVILNAMINSVMTSAERTGRANPDDNPNRRLLQAYKDELVAYLTKIRGPQPFPFKFKPLPRVTGDATEIVVTEYQIPPGDSPEYFLSQTGSDWSEGMVGRYQSGVLHDAVPGQDGNVYFSDPVTPERTVGRLDPKTGRVTNFKLADKQGDAVATHGAAVDSKGNIWLTNQSEDTMLKFDPNTEQFQRFPLPISAGEGAAGSVVNAVEVDPKGNIWSTARDGSMRLNPETGVYSHYKSITKGGTPYGVAVDSEGNAWMAQMGADRLMVTSGINGEVGEVALLPLEGVSAKDREIGERTGSTSNAAALYTRGPRRLGADHNGDTVWVAEYFAGQISKIDIHTRKVTTYKVPSRYSHPYDIEVDKNHMVWICLLNSDRLLKFNQFTEQFTEYPLPTLGTGIRHIAIDNSTTVPTIWLPYLGVNKIARVQFRTNTAAKEANNQQTANRHY